MTLVHFVWRTYKQAKSLTKLQSKDNRVLDSKGAKGLSSITRKRVKGEVKSLITIVNMTAKKKREKKGRDQ